MKILACSLLSAGLILCGLDTQQWAIATQPNDSESAAIIRVGNSRPKAVAKGSIVINRSSPSRNKSASRMDANS